MKPIFLIGYMGAGKSTLGRKLADEMNLQFIDTDTFIENRFRERIRDMFLRIGEDAFRLKEHYVIEELSGMQDCVIATGGGLPCFHNNMDIMKASGLTLYLEASAEQLAERLALCKRTRPTIYDKEGVELHRHITEALSVREPIYDTADIKVSISGVIDRESELNLAKSIASKIRKLIVL